MSADGSTDCVFPLSFACGWTAIETSFHSFYNRFVCDGMGASVKFASLCADIRKDVPDRGNNTNNNNNTKKN